MLSNKSIIVSSLCVLASSVLAGDFARDRAPQGFFNNLQECTVIDIQNNPRDKQVVKLHGRLTNYYGKDKYEFTDVTGTCIEVELDDDKSWSHIAKDQLIEIIGELDVDMFSIKIEVDEAIPLE